MMRSRAMRNVAAILTLLLFGAWIGVGVAHEHPGSASCQVCKLLHGTSADLVRLGPTPESLPERGPVALTSPTTLSDRLLSIPHGRAPPLL